MRRLVILITLLPSTFAGLLPAQHAVDPARLYYRVICLVYLTGTGQVGDAVLPEYVPKASAASSRDGIIAWSSQITDNGQMAIVHLVAVNHHAFDALLADTRPEIKVFEIGKPIRL